MQKKAHKTFHKLTPLSFITIIMLAIIINSGCEEVEGPINFSQYDTNKDGKISRKEFEKTKLSMTEFSRLDTNNDNHLSRKEFRFLKINF